MMGLSVDPIHIIQGEIYGLLAHLKLNTRWATYQPLLPESTILRSLNNLTNILQNESDFSSLDTCTYLEPFLLVIKSPETSGPITGTALTSVNKFLNLFITIRDIADSASHCKFEATDARSDEVVLMKILQVLTSCVKNTAGIYLSDDLVFLIVSTCYFMTDQSRSSELLKKTAEVAIQDIAPDAHIMLLVAPVVAALQSGHNQDNHDPSLQFSPNNDLFFSNLPPPTPEASVASTPVPSTPSTPVASPMPVTSPTSPTVNPHIHNSASGTVILNPRASSKIPPPFDSVQAYDKTALIKIFKHFVDNIAPSNSDNEMTRLLCLNLVNSIVQMRGAHLESIPEILILVQDDLFKSLLLNIQSKSIPIFSLTMRVFFNLFVALRRKLRAQFEEFFNVLLKSLQTTASIADNRFELQLQELALEGLRDFCKLPMAMTELFVNYDCELHCNNVFESLCKTLYKHSFPLSGPLNTLHILSLENLLAIVQSVDDRTKYKRYIAHHQLPNSASLEFMRRKAHKRVMSVAAEHFNRKAKDAFEYLTENHVYESMTPINIAHFLLETPKLNKTRVGEYLGKRENAAVLSEYLDYFTSHYPDYLKAYRAFLESFKIAGESAVVEHMFEMFAGKISDLLDKRDANVFPIKEQKDKLFVFLYSGLMLHTSTFNQNIQTKDRINLNSFERMLRPEGYTNELIHAMHKEMTVELVLDEESTTPGVINNKTWKNVIRKSHKIEDFHRIESNEYDKEIFPIILTVLIPAISSVFEKIESNALSQRVLDGFHLCAQVAANYNINESIDNLMNSLCANTTLIEKEGVGRDEQQQIFIGDNKAQLATITTFDIATKYTGHLGESWKNLITIICKMHKLGLLPTIFDQTIDFPIENKKPEKGADKQNQQKSSSLFKWFVAESEYIEETIENKDEEKARICVSNCHIKDLFLETKNLPQTSLEHLLQSLFLVTTPTVNGFNQKQALFCFDILTHVVLLNEDRLALVWGPWMKHIESIIQICDQSPKLAPFIEKTVISVMYILIRLLKHPEVSQSLGSLVKFILKPRFDTIAEKMSVALVQLVQTNIQFLSLTHSWEPIIGIIVLLSGNPKASTRACEALAMMIQQDTLNKEECEFSLHSINCFLESNTIPQTVTVKVMELLHYIFIKIPSVIDINPAKLAAALEAITDPVKKRITEKHQQRSLEEKQTNAWNIYWSPILKTISKLCVDKNLVIRNNAMSLIQKCILSPSLEVLSPQKWLGCFVDIVFPLLDSLKELPKESNYEDTRLRGSALLSKVFLQNLNTLIKLGESFPVLWKEILAYLRTYMGLSEVLSESVPESLKNMLLVMNNSGVFTPPEPDQSESAASTTTGQSLWELTWEIINEFCPKIREEYSTTTGIHVLSQIGTYNDIV
eukprot:gene4115-4805_t